MVTKIIDNKVVLIEDDEVILEMSFFADEFIWKIHKNRIVITTGDPLYDYLDLILSNDYIFTNDMSKKEKDILIWLSDQYCDYEDQDMLSKINRLIIKKENGLIIINAINLYCIKNNIVKSSYLITFSPAGNGAYAKNRETYDNFQDEIIRIYYELLYNKNLRKQKN